MPPTHGGRMTYVTRLPPGSRSKTGIVRRAAVTARRRDLAWGYRRTMSQPWDRDRVADLYRCVERHLDEAVELRHVLHSEPRVSGEERDTLQAVLAALDVRSDLPQDD